MDGSVDELLAASVEKRHGEGGPWAGIRFSLAMEARSADFHCPRREGRWDCWGDIRLSESSRLSDRQPAAD